MGEEQQMLAAHKLASEEEYLRQIADLISTTTHMTLEPPAAPDRFLCPLTKDIMLDPVIVTSGRVYERSAIERWLKNHDTCPVNRVPIDPKILIRVLDLRVEIAEWQSSNQSARTPVTPSSPLHFPSSTAGALRNLADGDDAIKRAIPLVPGGLERLVILLKSGSEGVQASAAGALCNLAVDAANQRAIAVVPGSLERLVTLLESGSEGVQASAAGALCNLALDVANQRAIAAVPGSLERLVALLESGSEAVQKQAAWTLQNLATDFTNKRAIVSVPGSLQRLVALLESRSEGVQASAAGALQKLAIDDRFHGAIAEVPGSLERLVTLLESGSEGVQEKAASVLRTLTRGAANERATAANARAIAAMPGSMQMLRRLKSSENEAVRREAAVVLENLRWYDVIESC
ncbi:vacuolar protein 8 [Klebsormidium nitens]|uniref:Vacuolar protein 8 n=1 Tax=Klebsormidium nitens TaxID=105231 RepID=A0A1Y1I195_KLENI|nr:vacuolar protein 8 [Klebsormidium nitens]|eukprot:GAQ84684.1 vacuolar protein 8 [Klebsormidium nitens]